VVNFLLRLLIEVFVFCANRYPKHWCLVQRNIIVVVLCKRSPNSWCDLLFPHQRALRVWHMRILSGIWCVFLKKFISCGWLVDASRINFQSSMSTFLSPISPHFRHALAA
jgi:hypothetical protein